MKFELVSGNDGFTVVLAEISSNKRLDITNLELECNEVYLEMDRDTERKIYRILLNNIEAFESE